MERLSSGEFLEAPLAPTLSSASPLPGLVMERGGTGGQSRPELTAITPAAPAQELGGLAPGALRLLRPLCSVFGL